MSVSVPLFTFMAVLTSLAIIISLFFLWFNITKRNVRYEMMLGIHVNHRGGAAFWKIRREEGDTVHGAKCILLLRVACSAAEPNLIAILAASSFSALQVWQWGGKQSCPLAKRISDETVIILPKWFDAATFNYVDTETQERGRSFARFWGGERGR